MKRAQLKCLIFALMLSVFFSGCIFGNDDDKDKEPDYGYRYAGLLGMSICEVYYKSPITRKEAIRLYDYFYEIEFFNDDSARTIQLTKYYRIYQVRFLIREGFVLDDEIIDAFKLIGCMVSENVFGGERVEMHSCNDNFETERVIVALSCD